MSSLIIDNISDYPVRFPLSFETRDSLYFPAKAIYQQASKAGLESCLLMMAKIQAYVQNVQLCREKIEREGILKKIKAFVLDTGKSALNLAVIRKELHEHCVHIMDRLRELNRYSFPQPQVLMEAEEANETHPSYVRSLDDSSACDRGR